MSIERRRTKRHALSLESLEGRVVLSTSHVAGAMVPTALVKGVTYLYLQGAGQGTFKHHQFLPADIPSTDVFKGTARFSPLGAVKVSASLTGTGFITQGHATGTLTFSNARGSVTLALTGPSEGGFLAPGSGTYIFAVKSGTGAFAHAIGTGKVVIALGSNSFNMSFQGDPNRF
jgi:murein DD-endopeptidase MepM/ murein hydrolase activator NlpD